MNAKQAKQIPLNLILNSLGLEPTEEKGDELIYHSPFRQEKVPSFSVNTKKNIWHDFGHGSGGNILDFIMTYYEMADVSTTLKQLDKLVGSQGEKIPTSQNQPTSVPQPQLEPIKPLKILKIQSLQNQALLQYLRHRRIRLQTAKPYVKEIYYQLGNANPKKRYFALAFPNDSNGYELRNPYFKGSIGKKDISVLAKRKRNPEAVTVFEGFIDFLSALCFYQVPQALTDVIVLNSVSLKERAIERIRGDHFEKVYLYLDRDDSGIRLKTHFAKQLSAKVTVVDKSDLYTDYKDFNELLISTTIPPT